MKTRYLLAWVFITLPGWTMADNHGAWWKAQGSGCLAWNSNPQPEETVTWSGDCVGGKASGDGRKIWRFRDEDGAMMQSEFVGTMREGKNNGQGTYRYSDGGTYEGDWVDDYFHGRGARTWADGTRYEGDWVAGDKTGRGTQTWGVDSEWAGDRYEGDWVKERAIHLAPVLSICSSEHFLEIARFRT